MFAARICHVLPVKLFRFCNTAQQARSISISRLDPAVRDFASALALKQPCFTFSSQHVKVLSEPEEFYQNLLDLIRRSQKRIFLSSLYIGSSESELVDALRVALRDKPDLHVYLTLDYNRSTRPGQDSPILSLLPLLHDYDDRVHISLFRSPQLKGTMSKIVPPRFNEGWGTWHVKIYGGDDEVMISGANLNTSYFTNRQDRYIHFTAQPFLANYCFSFLRTVAPFCYNVLPKTSSGSYTLSWSLSETEPWMIQPQMQKALVDLQRSHLLSSITFAAGKNDPSDDVFIFPVIQAGQFDIREEEQTLEMLFKHLALQECIPGSSLSMDLTSGYFGLYKAYQDLVLQSSLNCNIIAASPEANGFFGSKGISGLIPEGYTLLEQQFMRAVKAAGRSSVDDDPNCPAVHLKEWQRPGWTYHAKGIWLYPSAGSHPVLTLFGSTNLNSRSSHLDTELSFVMITSSASLRQRLHEEIQSLRHWAVPWQGEQRHVRWRTKAIVGLVGGML